MNFFPMNCFPLVRWSPCIQVACCPVCSAIGWLAELLGVASLRKFRLPAAVSFVWKYTEKEGVRKWFPVCLRYYRLGRCVDGCTDRGRRAVRSGVICGCPHITPLRRRGLGSKTSWEVYRSPSACSLWRLRWCCGWSCMGVAGLGCRASAIVLFSS